MTTEMNLWKMQYGNDTTKYWRTVADITMVVAIQPDRSWGYLIWEGNGCIGGIRNPEWNAEAAMKAADEHLTLFDPDTVRVFMTERKIAGRTYHEEICARTRSEAEEIAAKIGSKVRGPIPGRAAEACDNDWEEWENPGGEK
jgi:hypothetical protein